MGPPALNIPMLMADVECVALNGQVDQSMWRSLFQGLPAFPPAFPLSLDIDLRCDVRASEGLHMMSATTAHATEPSEGFRKARRGNFESSRKTGFSFPLWPPKKATATLHRRIVLMILPLGPIAWAALHTAHHNSSRAHNTGRTQDTRQHRLGVVSEPLHARQKQCDCRVGDSGMTLRCRGSPRGAQARKQASKHGSQRVLGSGATRLAKGSSDCASQRIFL
ncbi:hypothetical protein B0T11DRAFT_104577 [Plectosphaerella cucumerina]|uniref:Uncharacterized protein n=1 Tax=Plectosphaerella cucumerina TaxID=40658 RepID=A0A8K0T8Z2_9PEZI|nr:hypothetical protein B0T11DRAFT_104577 [Plectosphaerella cucumerina]